MQIIENKNKRTFAIYNDGIKYRTRELRRSEFRQHRYNTPNEWIKLLNTDLFVYKVRIPSNDGIIKPTQLENNFLNIVRLKFGYIDLKNDFFNNKLTTYFKCSYANNDKTKTTHLVYSIE